MNTKDSNESGVGQAIDASRIVGVAMGSPLLHIKQLIPYLEQRELMAKKHFIARTTDEMDACLEYILQINKEIKIILGL